MPDGETAIMNVSRGTYYILNGVGGQIWEIIKEPTPVQNVCDDILAQYDVEAEECTKQVLRYLDELLNEQLITVHEPS